MHQFYCELEEERCGLRGLMRVAYINMSEPCSTCPPPLAQATCTHDTKAIIIYIVYG